MPRAHVVFDPHGKGFCVAVRKAPGSTATDFAIVLKGAKSPGDDRLVGVVRSRVSGWQLAWVAHEREPRASPRILVHARVGGKFADKAVADGKYDVHVDPAKTADALALLLGIGDNPAEGTWIDVAAVGGHPVVPLVRRLSREIERLHSQLRTNGRNVSFRLGMATGREAPKGPSEPHRSGNTDIAYPQAPPYLFSASVEVCAIDEGRSSDTAIEPGMAGIDFELGRARTSGVYVRLRLTREPLLPRGRREEELRGSVRVYYISRKGAGLRQLIADYRLGGIEHYDYLVEQIDPYRVDAPHVLDGEPHRVMPLEPIMGSTERLLRLEEIGSGDLIAIICDPDRLVMEDCKPDLPGETANEAKYEKPAAINEAWFFYEGRGVLRIAPHNLADLATAGLDGLYADVTKDALAWRRTSSYDMRTQEILDFVDRAGNSSDAATHKAYECIGSADDMIADPWLIVKAEALAASLRLVLPEKFQTVDRIRLKELYEQDPSLLHVGLVLDKLDKLTSHWSPLTVAQQLHERIGAAELLEAALMASIPSASTPLAIASWIARLMDEVKTETPRTQGPASRWARRT